MNPSPLRQFVLARLFWVKVAAVCLWTSWLISLAPSGFRRDVEGKPIGTDHVAFYSAARLITEGRGPLMYDYDYLGAYQSEILQWSYGLDAYRNPPFYALLYVPTARMPYLASFWIWTVVSALLLLGGLRIIGPSRPASYLLWSLSFFPMFAVFGFGQNSLLSFGIFCAVYGLLQKQRYFFAGMTAGLLLFKPQLLLGIGVWWLIDGRRYWSAILGGMSTAAILAAVCFVLLPQETDEYIRRFRGIARYDAFAFYLLHTPRGFGTLLAFDNKAVGNRLALVCGILAVGCFIAFWRRHRHELPIVYAGMIFLTLWASPHTLIYEWCIVLIAAVLLWEHVPQHRDTWLPLFALGWVTMFISTGLSQLQLRLTRPEFAIQISVPILAFIAVMAAFRLDDPFRKPSPTE